MSEAKRLAAPGPGDFMPVPIHHWQPLIRDTAKLSSEYFESTWSIMWKKTPASGFYLSRELNRVKTESKFTSIDCKDN